ncbi:P-II family nitrogen regulator [Salinisphaera sp. SWV1]|uniref:P-II family nitrogen regulator n=1 Tax=Salinisphaera sp. SWV1 TaxID=3454139 RepID=UPI003F85DEDF
MKEIKAYIRAHRTDPVIDALAEVPARPGIAVVALKEVGHRAGGNDIRTVDMVKLEIDVPDAQADTVVEIVLAAARTGAGHPGDGKVYVSDVATAIDIATGHVL